MVSDDVHSTDCLSDLYYLTTSSFKTEELATEELHDLAAHCHCTVMPTHDLLLCRHLPPQLLPPPRSDS